MIHRGETVHIGREAGTDKDHLLWYSRKDEAFFVTVLDSRIGQVVTVLTEQMHHDLAWSIPENQRKTAKELAYGKPGDSPSSPSPQPIREIVPKRNAQPFTVELTFVDRSGREKRVVIGSYQHQTPETLARCPSFINTIRTTIERIASQNGYDFSLWVRSDRGAKLAPLEGEELSSAIDTLLARFVEKRAGHRSHRNDNYDDDRPRSKHAREHRHRSNRGKERDEKKDW